MVAIYVEREGKGGTEHEKEGFESVCIFMSFLMEGYKSIWGCVCVCCLTHHEICGMYILRKEERKKKKPVHKLSQPIQNHIL
mmetsp:Transcript_38623/g.54369  ORF Transcript_38623/g.54369 Transcript_38623/m.54369 type:complete len:82 (-) Transcript_38623:58-303(-)